MTCTVDETAPRTPVNSRPVRAVDIVGDFPMGAAGSDATATAGGTVTALTPEMAQLRNALAVNGNRRLHGVITAFRLLAAALEL
jgi:hypothetical protein